MELEPNLKTVRDKFPRLLKKRSGCYDAWLELEKVIGRLEQLQTEYGSDTVIRIDVILGENQQ